MNKKLNLWLKRRKFSPATKELYDYIKRFFPGSKDTRSFTINKQKQEYKSGSDFYIYELRMTNHNIGATLVLYIQVSEEMYTKYFKKHKSSVVKTSIVSAPYASSYIYGKIEYESYDKIKPATLLSSSNDAFRYDVLPQFEDYLLNLILAYHKTMRRNKELLDKQKKEEKILDVVETIKTNLKG